MTRLKKICHFSYKLFINKSDYTQVHTEQSVTPLILQMCVHPCEVMAQHLCTLVTEINGKCGNPVDAMIAQVQKTHLKLNCI